MFLADCDILKEIEDGNIIIEPYDRRWLGCNSYDFHLADKIGKYDFSDAKEWDLTKDVFPVIEIPLPYKLMPMEYCLIITKEKIGVSNTILGLTTFRSNLGRSPLIFERSDLTDSGFYGHLSGKLYNPGPLPIVLHPNMRVFQMMFAKLSKAVDVPYTKRALSKNIDQDILRIPGYKIDKELLK